MKKLGMLFLAVCFFLSGCSGSKEARVGYLESKNLEIEGRLESMEQRLTALEVYYQDLAKAKTAKPDEPAVIDTKTAVNMMTDSDVQIALKNAGFYTGTVDGLLGPGTANAIREFQQANGLNSDGIAGDKTKGLLLQYLKKSDQ
jgi:murein L,D-transpeptidase YcbB/YkuD